jgi:phage gpG-like protein
MFDFIPWRKFCAFKDKKVLSLFLRSVAKDAETRLKEGIRNPPKTGVKRVGRKRASINNARQEFPANQTGRLLGSVTSESNANSATVGTTMYYGRYLRYGTRKMRRRRMSDDALSLVVPRSLARLRGWVVWRRE